MCVSVAFVTGKYSVLLAKNQYLLPHHDGRYLHLLVFVNVRYSTGTIFVTIAALQRNVYN